MPTPALSRELAEEAVEALLSCIRDGFKVSTPPSARTEASRRLGITNGTYEGRLRSATQRYGIDWLSQARDLEAEIAGRKPARPAASATSAPPAAVRVDPAPPAAEDLGEMVRAMLVKRPHSAAELTFSTKAELGQVLDAIDGLTASGCNILRRGDRFEIPKRQQASYESGAAVQIVSGADNTFTIGACGDQHIGSKYFRKDVLDDLYRRYEDAGVRHVFNTGNWIDGEARFNTYDLETHGLDGQVRHLIRDYPQVDGLTTYAVWGDDHEGWYAQREGVNVGAYAEAMFRNAGREDWVDLGFMEAHIELVNANTGAKAIMAVVHPGGGSAYALSYSIQKIVESYEGGEKPAVGLFGHYHKMECALIRNVWTAQTGAVQDQTPFMRKKRLEAHVGGLIIRLEQDPASGAIIGFSPTMLRYFNKAWYAQNGRWSKHDDVRSLPRTLGGL